MNPWALLIAFVIGAAAAWQVQDWRADSAEKDRMEREAEFKRLQRNGIASAAESHEHAKVRIETEFVPITQEVERVVQKIEYRDGSSCLDDDGLRVLRAAIGPAAAGSEPAPALPGPGQAR